MQSVWSDTKKLPSFGSFFDGEIYTDVLIIGGGLAGILCAYELQQRKVDCLLVEADTICSGMTKNTTAKITSQHRLIYGKIMEEFGLEMAQLYYDANQKALDQYRTLCQSIACDWEEKDSFVYSLIDPHKLLLELEAMEKMSHPAELIEHVPLPFETLGAVCFRNQAQFHPLKFVSAIAKNLHVMERTKIVELAPHTAKTDETVIHAKQMIVTTHFPMLNKHGAYFLKMYQSRSYVIAYEDKKDSEFQLNGMYVDEADDGMSFRNYKDLLLIGGSGKRTGKRSGKWDAISMFAASSYPYAKERYRWAAQDCMTLDQIPYIGPYAKSTEGLYVATGFNKWGMTSAMVAANLLADQIMGIDNPYATLFSPQRTMLRSQLVVNGMEATKNLLTPSVQRCPHMGCALKWNKEERSWDCPCHGSRFEEDGTLINNPACDDRKVKCNRNTNGN